jgi:hypothetical protein
MSSTTSFRFYDEALGCFNDAIPWIAAAEKPTDKRQTAKQAFSHGAFAQLANTVK